MKREMNLSSWCSGHSQSVEINESSVFELTSIFSSEIRPSDWILLDGDLGAGKTTFVSTLLNHFAKGSVFTSPTFSLLNVHEFQTASFDLKRACHLDLYRIHNDEELIHLGLELQVNEASLVLIEWAENVSPEGWGSFFQVTRCRRPKRIIQITIDHVEQADRRRYSFGWLSYDKFIGKTQ